MNRRILMCKPDFYGIKYVINPWMNLNNQPNRDMALRQWRALYEILEREGMLVSRLERQIEGFPDMVFTANAGLAHGRRVLMSNFRPPERRGEIRYFSEWFWANGYQTHRMPRDIFWEGEGDALHFQDNLLCGYGIRSDELGGELAAEFCVKKPVLLKLVSEHFYHLDTCLCPIGDMIMYYPGAFDDASCGMIENLAETIIVSPSDANNFVCNGIYAENRYQNSKKIITMPMSDVLRSKLAEFGIGTVETNLSEFIKAGGSAKCLTLFV